MIKEISIFIIAYPIIKYVPGATQGALMGVASSLATTALTWGATKLVENVIYNTGSYIAYSFLEHDKQHTSIDINDEDGWNYIMKNDN